MPSNIKLTNSLVFQSVSVPVPAEKEISAELYENRLYRKTCNTCQQQKKFIEQWNELLDHFANIVFDIIDHDLSEPIGNPADQYLCFYDRLSRGIADSILDRGDGLLPRQNDDTFASLKLFLESICLYCLRNPSDQRLNSMLNNLYANLNACGPGLFTHFQQTFFELYHPEDGLFYWLADLRELILTGIAQEYCERNQVGPVFRPHVYTAFSQYAKTQGWHLLQENHAVNDMMIARVVPREQADVIYADVDRKFKIKYASEAISYLAERLANFISTIFLEKASGRKLSSKNEHAFSQFFTQIMPVLDSFGLQLNFFLEDVSNDKHTKYVVCRKTLGEMQYFVMMSMHHLGVLELDPLNFLVTMSVNHARKAIPLVSKYLLDSVTPDVWLHYLKIAFNANPPEKYVAQNSQQPTSEPRLFRSQDPFFRFSKALGVSPRNRFWNGANQLSALLQSEVFVGFMREQLKLDSVILDGFLKKFAPSEVQEETLGVRQR